MTKQEKFINKIAPIIVSEAGKRGYKFPSAIIAQACLESGWGESKLAADYHNYFGMKCGSSWRGASVNMKTKEEYKPGVLTSIRDNFRAYASMQAGVSGYFDFISTPRYARLKKCTSSADYLQTIKNCGYATSSGYVANTYGVVAKYNLERFDKKQTKAVAGSKRDIVSEVIAGKWGNGLDRKRRLESAGFNYADIQAKVNLRLAKKG